MRRIFLEVLVMAQLMSVAAQGQSLGDVARETQEKRNADSASGVLPKVITNKDLSQDPGADEDAAETQPAAGAVAGKKTADHRSAEQRLSEQRAAAQWKRQILAQENRMTNLQARIDEINSSIRAGGGTAEYEGPYNRYAARQIQRAAQIQQQLDEQKRKLEQLQEAARHAGMHTPVYDP
jgi:predicted RNase H-like nuclease (RuvC/YqgF family)